MRTRTNQNILEKNLDNELDLPEVRNEYAAWWYCCIPVTVIDKNGLPLPVFIRWDDVEYSLRCRAKFITMNGLCVWHMGFATKWNVATDCYQEYRNTMIAKACSGILGEVDGYKKLYRAYRAELLKFNYAAAEVILKAFEDYLKGPDFLKRDLGEKLMKENAGKNEKLIPVDEIDGFEMANLFDCYYDPPRTFINKWLLRMTFNGHRFWPEKWCRKEYAYIGCNRVYQPEKIAMRKELVAVNPYEKKAAVRKLDKKRFNELQKRFRRARRYYIAHNRELTVQYREKTKYLTSKEFWKKYLEL